jgi:hypothetical protein
MFKTAEDYSAFIASQSRERAIYQAKAADATTRASLESTLIRMLVDAKRASPDVFNAVPDFDNAVAASMLASWILGQ